MASANVQTSNADRATPTTPATIRLNTPAAASTSQTIRRTQRSHGGRPLPPLTRSTLLQHLDRLEDIHELCKQEFRRFWRPNNFDPTSCDQMIEWLERSYQKLAELPTSIIPLVFEHKFRQEEQWAEESHYGTRTLRENNVRIQVYSPSWCLAFYAIDQLQDKVDEIERWMCMRATGVPRPPAYITNNDPWRAMSRVERIVITEFQRNDLISSRIPRWGRPQRAVVRRRIEV